MKIKRFKESIESMGWELLGDYTEDIKRLPIISMSDKHINMLKNDISKTNLKINNSIYYKNKYIKFNTLDELNTIRFSVGTHESISDIQVVSIEFRRGMSFDSGLVYIRIIELPDEWFLVEIDKRFAERFLVKGESTFYKCDQYYGLSNLIKFLLRTERLKVY